MQVFGPYYFLYQSDFKHSLKKYVANLSFQIAMQIDHTY